MKKEECYACTDMTVRRTKCCGMPLCTGCSAALQIRVLWCVNDKCKQRPVDYIKLPLRKKKRKKYGFY